MLTGNDKIAAVVYGVAAELNLRVGEDVAVTGFGGNISAGLLHPHPTTVVIPGLAAAGRKHAGPPRNRSLTSAVSGAARAGPAR